MKRILVLVLLVLINVFIFSETLYFTKSTLKDTIKLQKVIIDNTLSIETNNKKLILNKDYSFDKGLIILYKTDYDSLKISYKIINDNLFYVNKKYEIKSINNDSNNTIFRKIMDKNNLSIGGIKGFFISMNNSGNIDINQSLELYLNGNMNENWKLKGYIYDNSANSYLNSYNTSISAIENLYITIYDSINLINLGNYSFTGLNGIFNNKNREILGIAAKTNIKNYPIKCAIANQKGKLKSIEFYCIEGIQGPYSLIDNQTLSDYIIAPGSEVVYLNGEKLKQGEEFDYTINYQNGEIYFTHNKPVDNNSYVYAEFQTYENANPINGYYIQSGNDSSLFNVLFIREEANIIDTTLMSIIKNTYSDSSSINIPQYQYVGENKGNYIFIDSFFQYTGENNGDYIIHFNYVGLGNGDYVFSSEIQAYVYVGKNQGNYSVYKKTDLPFESNYLSVNSLFNVYFGNISIETGGGLYKNNKYISNYSKDVSYSVIFKSNDFQYNKFSVNFLLNKKYISQFYKKHWIEKNKENILINNILSSDNDIENINTCAVNTKYNKYFNVSYTFSLFDTIINHNIHILFDSIANTKSTFNINTFSLNDSLIYEKKIFNIINSYYIINPFYEYQKEEKNNKNIIEHTYALYYKNKNNISYTNENNYSNDTLVIKKDIYRLNNSISYFNNILNTSLEYKHIENILQNTSANRLYAKINNFGLYKYLKYNHTLGISSVSNIKQKETYIFVGEGKGEYIYDSLSNTYIYDEFEGDYIKIIENIFSTEPVARREYSLSLNLLLKHINMSTNYSYNDNAYFVSTISYDSIENYNVYATNNLFYDNYKYIIPYIETNYKKNNSIYNYYNYSFENKFGIYSTQKFNYKFYYTIKNTNIISNYSKQDFQSKSYNMELNIKNEKTQYNIKIIYENFNGYYNDSNYNNLFIQLNKNSIQPNGRIELNNNLYLGVLPEITIVSYKNLYSNIPTIIYYNYPEGLSYKGTYYINFLNKNINISLKYINEYTKKYSYKHKVEVSLYTYF